MSAAGRLQDERRLDLAQEAVAHGRQEFETGRAAEALGGNFCRPGADAMSGSAEMTAAALTMRPWRGLARLRGKDVDAAGGLDDSETHRCRRSSARPFLE